MKNHLRKKVELARVSLTGKDAAGKAAEGAGEGRGGRKNEGADAVEGGVAMVVVRLGKRGPRIVTQGARRPR